MKKKFISLLIAAMTAGVLAGCGNNAESASSSVESTEESIAVEVESGVTQPEADNWDSMEFVLDGQGFTLPLKYASINESWYLESLWGLDDNGDVVEKDASTVMVAAGSYQYVDLYNDDYNCVLNARFSNDTDGEIALSDCDITAVTLSTSVSSTTGEMLTYPKLVLPSGITIGSTKAEIEEAYGEAETINEDSEDYVITMTYAMDGNKLMELTLYKDADSEASAEFDGTLKDITIMAK